MTCRLHPRYQAILAPRSTAPGCTCRAVYEAKVLAAAQRAIQAIRAGKHSEALLAMRHNK